MILPRHFEDTFQDAAIYAEPHDLQGIIRRPWDDPAAYQRQSAKGLERVQQWFSYETSPTSSACGVCWGRWISEASRQLTL